MSKKSPTRAHESQKRIYHNHCLSNNLIIRNIIAFAESIFLYNCEFELLHPQTQKNLTIFIGDSCDEFFPRKCQINNFMKLQIKSHEASRSVTDAWTFMDTFFVWHRDTPTRKAHKESLNPVKEKKRRQKWYGWNVSQRILLQHPSSLIWKSLQKYSIIPLSFLHIEIIRETVLNASCPAHRILMQQMGCLPAARCTS